MVAILRISGDADREGEAAGLSHEAEAAGYMSRLERAGPRQNDRELCVVETTGDVQCPKLFT